MPQDKTYIYGKHAVMEAILHAPRVIREMYVAPVADNAYIKVAAEKAGVPVGTLNEKNMPREISVSATHQGVIALVSLGNLMRPYKAFIAELKPTSDTALVLVNEVQDPQNVGAIIRSAAAFGVEGVLIPEHRQAQITGAVAKVSAGMVFRVPLVDIGNVNTTVLDLKKRGFWIYGLAGEGAQKITDEKFTAPVVFVVGNEAEGLRSKTREHCDILLSIPTDPRCESLNAATSAAVALYAWSVQHPDALK